MIREDGGHHLAAFSILISLMWWFMAEKVCGLELFPS